MRISLLLQREPFGTILEQTLAGFLETWSGRAHQVHWYEGRPSVGRMRRQGQQPWLCNIYLNAIFVPGAENRTFDPIRREFGRSLAWWRRPVQRAYVAVGTSRRGARWLAQAGVGISPPLPEAERVLIVAGNHKMRLLDRAGGLSYGILKSGFPPRFMQREIAARQQAAELGLPVPPLRAVAEDGTWFSERYVSGTPANRLADSQTAREAMRKTAEALATLLEQTLEREPLDAYVARLQGQIERLMRENHLLSKPQKQTLAKQVKTLTTRILRLSPAVGGSIATALTHGDFQPANILVNGEKMWLIDWEYAARRQAGYDALVYVSNSRSPAGLTARLGQMVDEGDGADSLPLARWPGLGWEDVSRRRVHGLLFLLEELALHLEENANPCFYRLGDGLAILQVEIPSVLESVVAV
jgi:tRNA A-37 threonylcarbamoyl transferase component Bud32